MTPNTFPASHTFHVQPTHKEHFWNLIRHFLCCFLCDILVFIWYCLAACLVGTHVLSEHTATIFKVKLVLLQTCTKCNTQHIVLHFWGTLCSVLGLEIGCTDKLPMLFLFQVHYWFFGTGYSTFLLYQSEMCENNELFVKKYKLM
jgi:hypothetical protein